MPELARQPVAERLARAIGVVTAGYAASTLVRPDVLSRPTGLGSSAGDPGRSGGAAERGGARPGL